MAEQQDGEREPQPIDEEAAWAAIVAGYGEEPVDPPGARPFRPVEDLALPDMPEDTASGEESGGGRGNGSRHEGGEDTGAGEGADSSGAGIGGAAAGGPVGPDDGERPAAEKPDAARKPEAAEKPDKFRKPEAPEQPEPPEKPALGSSVVFAPGVGMGGGPRDYSLAEPDGGAGGDDAGDLDGGHFVPPEPPPLPEADTTTKFAWLAVIGGPVLMLLAVLLRWDMTWWLTTLCVGGFLGGFVTLVARMKHDDEDDDGFDDPGRGAVV
ncbi:hypothetical protein ACFY7C_13540 [Streptomyces sp. NPDC012769]|uniref:hypothetical protein n=1 Tax=Streptomyces sp. NPDC012769 TaxID=3364848 RepID=UPI0036D1F96C